MSAKNKLYLTIVLMAALLAGGGFAVWFLLGLIAEGSEEIVKLQTEQRMIETQRNRLDDMTRNYESLKDSIPSIDSVLLDPLDKLKFIMLVEELSAKTSVEHVIEAVAAPSASDKEKASGAGSIMFNINVAGDFPNVIKESAERYTLNGLALYLYELAHRANQFYEQVHILEDDNTARLSARLTLVSTTARVLKDGLALLGIKTPERI